MASEASGIEIQNVDMTSATEDESVVQYYVNLTEEDLAKMDKDSMYIQVADGTIIAAEGVATWTPSENALPAEETVFEDSAAAESPANESKQALEPERNDTVGGCGAFQWPKQAVGDLIPIYLDSQWMFESTTYTFKQAWQNIANQLHAKGWPNLTGTQVSSKWRGLKKQCRKMEAMRGKEDKYHKPWAFYLPMKEALAKDRQNSEPEADDGSSRRKPPSAGDRSTSSTEREQDIGDDDDLNDSDSEPPPAKRRAPNTKRKRKRREEMPTWVRLLCEDLAERRRERQAEKQQLMTILKKLTDKL